MVQQVGCCSCRRRQVGASSPGRHARMLARTLNITPLLAYPVISPSAPADDSSWKGNRWLGIPLVVRYIFQLVHLWAQGRPRKGTKYSPVGLLFTFYILPSMKRTNSLTSCELSEYN